MSLGPCRQPTPLALLCTVWAFMVPGGWILGDFLTLWPFLRHHQQHSASITNVLAHDKISQNFLKSLSSILSFKLFFLLVHTNARFIKKNHLNSKCFNSTLLKKRSFVSFTWLLTAKLKQWLQWSFYVQYFKKDPGFWWADYFWYNLYTSLANI